MYYSWKDLEARTKRGLEGVEAIAKAWESVTYKTKKDGAPFANMQNNIEGAKYKQSDYIPHVNEYELHIYATDCTGRYVSDDIYMYERISSPRHPELLKEKPQNIVASDHGDIYKYDLNDIKQAIFERIEQLKKCANSYRNTLEKGEEIYNEYKSAILNANNKLEESCKVFGLDSTFDYILREETCLY